MWCLLLFFPAVKLAQVIRRLKPVYCNHLVIMTVFVGDQWLNIYFIPRLLTPTGQRNLLLKHLLSKCLCFCLLFFPFLFSLSISFFFNFLLYFTMSLFLCLTVLIPHRKQFLSVHLMEAKGRQNDAIIKHGLYNSHGTVGCLLCWSLPLVQYLALVSWLPTPETHPVDTYLCRLTHPITTKPTPNIHSLFDLFMIYDITV